MVLLPILNRSGLSAVVPIVPGVVTQIVSTSQFLLSAHHILAISFDAPKIWNELTHDVRSATSVPSERSSKLICLQKPTRHSLPLHPYFSLVCYVLRLMLTAFALCSDAL